MLNNLIEPFFFTQIVFVLKIATAILSTTNKQKKKEAERKKKAGSGAVSNQISFAKIMSNMVFWSKF